MRFYKLALLTFLILTPNLTFASDSYLIVKTSDNELFDLSKSKSKVVIINFWASWCTICRAEMTKLQKLRKIYSKENLEIIGLNVDNMEDDDSNFDRIAQISNYKMAKVSEVKKMSFEIPNLIPTTYLITKSKIIKDPNSIEDATKEALDE